MTTKNEKRKTLGQIFTPESIVSKMLLLRKNDGPVLEPTAGNGAFFNKLESTAVGIEIDERICPASCLNMDFFEYPVSNTFQTQIGNPPYVAFKNILEKTKNTEYIRILLEHEFFDKRTNLYLFIIKKCLEHMKDVGDELILITPRDFINATSAIQLNKQLWKEGTITHFFDLGDERVFQDATPNCAIWRFEKGNFLRKTTTNGGIKNFIFVNGQLVFTNVEYSIDFNSLFFVKVGGVSGDDAIFTHKKGNAEFVCSYTRSTGKTKRMFYNEKSELLYKYKNRLLKRGLKLFDDSNWWMWGRDFYHSLDSRIYVNCKTRIKNPFFINDCRNYDGAVLAVFIKNDIISKEEAQDLLNQVDWNELGFKIGDRYVFSQRSLENIKLPDHLFSKYKIVDKKMALTVDDFFDAF